MQQCHIRFISETYQLCKFSVIMVGADTEQAWGRYVPNMVLIWRAWSSERKKRVISFHYVSLYANFT